MRFVWVLTVCALLPCASAAEGLLDGMTFRGMIGPASNPDLEDQLRFAEGHFWSGICVRCGFVPGPYEAQRTDRGIVFEGMLESDGRGEFHYQGLLTDDGEIEVEIYWERRRWYWTNRRDLIFRGKADSRAAEASLQDVLIEMAAVDPEGDPLCSRF